MTTRPRRRTPQVPHAGRWARGAISVATRALPAGQVRERYRREFVAEMYGMPGIRRTSHTLQLLRSTAALRAAVTSQAQPLLQEATMPTTPLGCRLNLHHTWVLRSTEDGNRYRRCSRCGKDKYDPPHGSGDWAGAGGGISG